MRKWLSGRASPCQGEGREFESRLPLQGDVAKWIRRGSAKPLFTGSNPVVASIILAGVAELADAADLKSYAKMSTSGFTFKIELLY